MAYFYSLLFTANPELRAMFPLAMDEQRKALSGALARCVWSMDNPQSLHEYLTGLGRDHRKYGVQEQHYQVFGETLATALRLLNGRAWTQETAAAWHTAVSHICSVMAAAAQECRGRAAVVGRGGHPARTALPRPGRAHRPARTSHFPTSQANT